MYFTNKKILNFLSNEKELNIFKKKLSFTLIKKKPKKSLWQKVSKKRRQSLNKIEENKSLFFIPKESLVESQVKESLMSLIPQYHAENSINKLYQPYIQNKNSNERAYAHFYNKLSAKIDILKIINLDQGKNIALNPNIVCKLISLLTYSAELVSSAILIGIAEATRHGVNEISDMRKIKNAKNKLNHCITDLNFIKLVSIILTKTHEPDFSHQENIDYFIDEQFLKFWSVFKKQAKLYSDSQDLNSFWSTCLFEYFKELKCPLLKDNFEHCLSEMTEILKRDANLTTQYKGNMLGMNGLNQYETSAPISQENIFFSQLILQAAALHYLTQIKQLIHVSNTTASSKLAGSTFWRNEAYHTTDFNQQSIPIINPTFSPGLITSY
jgi:hypothetical protein